MSYSFASWKILRMAGSGILQKCCTIRLMANRHLGLNKRIEEEKHWALRSHFANLGKKVTVMVELPPYTHRINYPLPSSIPSVSIIIPTRDQVHILKRSLKALYNERSFRNMKSLWLVMPTDT